MTPPLRPPLDLLVVAASHGENLRLAERFVAAAEQQGLRAEVLDLSLSDLPLFTSRSERQQPLPALESLEGRLRQAPRWVICAPEYNGSIPPVLSSAIAWLSVQNEDFRSLFNGRPVAIATHSGGGGYTLITALRLQLAHLGAEVMGRYLVSNASRPAKDESIADLVQRLAQLQPMQLP